MIVVLALVALSSTGCSDDKKGSSGGNAALKNSCNAQCDAQDQVPSCDPLVDVATCKMICGSLAASVKAACADAYKAYYDCSAAAGFECAGALGVAQKNNACMAEQNAVNDCNNGGGAGTGGGAGSGAPACEGAMPSGTCPQVQCQCPDGVHPVSGFDNDANGCKCWDTETCKDLTCS
jgi:hypothetical protein